MSSQALYINTTQYNMNKIIKPTPTVPAIPVTHTRRGSDNLAIPKPHTKNAPNSKSDRLAADARKLQELLASVRPWETVGHVDPWSPISSRATTPSLTPDDGRSPTSSRRSSFISSTSPSHARRPSFASGLSESLTRVSEEQARQKTEMLKSELKPKLAQASKSQAKMPSSAPSRQEVDAFRLLACSVNGVPYRFFK
ncbi:hypothetical protein VKT23_013393 [Stygiomarasmius scandens]|uniref:Uncharacterized protein n=1 Tax=Marasmiellus scandens TaxID=2682957 RepID=A0ABR1J386_9AGAR